MPRLFLGLLLGALLALAPASAQETPPNFVILFADDLGINDLGCFGRKDQNTPNLDKLAAEGARFTQAYAAASVCSPSRAALMTGQSPARLKITTFLTGRSDRASHRVLAAPINLHLPDGVQTIAQLLKPKGYVSAVVGKWHLGGKGHQPTDHGFDEYFAGKPNPGAESPQGGKGELGQADHPARALQRVEAAPDLKISHVVEMRAGFVCRQGHPLLSLHPDGVPFDALLAFPIASIPLSQEVARLLVDHYGPQANPAQMTTLQCEDIASLIDVVGQTDAIYLGIVGAAREGMAQGRLVELGMCTPLQGQARLALITLAGRTELPVMSVFRDFVQKHLID